jgi:hypothetical protein
MMTHELPAWPVVSAERARELQFMPYRQYLLTPEWAERRRVTIIRAGHRCQVCNKPGSLDVHHRTYVRRGDELPADLTVLCDGCHALYHGKIHASPAPKPDRKPVSPRRQRAPKRERDAFNSGRPRKPSADEIADHAWAGITCRDCGSEPRSACIGEREEWRSVCRGRYVDAAISLKRDWSQLHPTWQRLEERARTELATAGCVAPASLGWREVTARVREWVADGRY